MRVSHVARKAMNNMLEEVRAEQKFVLISVGGVEFGNVDSLVARDIAGCYISMLHEIKDIFPNAKVLCASVLPRRQPLSEGINKEIKEFNDI